MLSSPDPARMRSSPPSPLIVSFPSVPSRTSMLDDPSVGAALRTVSLRAPRFWMRSSCDCGVSACWNGVNECLLARYSASASCSRPLSVKVATPVRAATSSAPELSGSRSTRLANVGLAAMYSANLKPSGRWNPSGVRRDGRRPRRSGSSASPCGSPQARPPPRRRSRTTTVGRSRPSSSTRATERTRSPTGRVKS